MLFNALKNAQTCILATTTTQRMAQPNTEGPAPRDLKTQDNKMVLHLILTHLG